MAKAPTKTGQDGAGDPQKQPDPQDGQAVTDAEQAAALVGVEPAEVFAFRLYDTKVVVVTVAGQKLEAAL